LADEFHRRLIVDAWAAGFIVTMFGSISWGFLIMGGLAPMPPGLAALVTVMGGGGVAVMVAIYWLKWRRS